MTAPPAPPPPSPWTPGWWLRPRVALLLTASLIVALALLVPERRAGLRGDPRLTTHSRNPQGAGALYELAGRLGWRASRQEERGVPPLGAGTVRALLAPVEPLSRSEVHAALEDVRRGGALLVVLAGQPGPLEDSLGVRRSLVGQLVLTGTVGAVQPHGHDCSDTRGALDAWPTLPNMYGLRWTGAPPVAARVFAEARVGEDRPADGPDSARVRPAVVGYPLGAGRVVIASDADMFRNDVLRVCTWDVDVLSVRMLEYLTTGSPLRRAIVFDEYHQGFGSHPGSTSAVLAYLGDTGSGRALLQLAIAGLVLLAAAAPRPLPPRDEPHIERRSPFEHVEALSRAYAQVRASRTVTQRLVGGVRRRAGARLRLAVSGDDGFLDAAAERYPELAAELQVVRRALREPVSTFDLDRAAAALERLESSLMTPRK